MLLLRYLAFDTTVEQPHPLALHYLLLLRAPRNLCEASIAVINDSAAISAECAALVPRLLATAAIAVAADMTQVRLRERWHTAFDVNETELADASRAILAAYERHGRRTLERRRDAKAADLEQNPLLKQLAARARPASPDQTEPVAKRPKAAEADVGASESLAPTDSSQNGGAGGCSAKPGT